MPGKTGEALAARWTGKVIREGLLPLAVLWLAAVFAVWGVHFLWRGELGRDFARREQHLVQQDLAGVEAHLSQRLDDIEKSLTALAGAAGGWAKERAPGVMPKLRRRGRFWYRPEAKGAGELLVFADGAVLSDLVAGAGGEQFDPLARIALTADPALRGIALITLAGVLRRQPPGRLVDRLTTRDQFLSLRAVREGVRVAPGRVGWLAGAELDADAAAGWVTAVAPYTAENAMAGVVVGEVDTRSLLTDGVSTPGAWVALLDAGGFVLAADSAARELFGSGRVALQSHVRRDVAGFGRKITGRQRGAGVQPMKGGDLVYAFHRVPRNGWTLLVALPAGSLLSGGGSPAALSFSLASGATLLLSLLLLLVILRFRAVGRKAGVRAARLLDRVAEAVSSIGGEGPVPAIETAGLAELEALNEAVRNAARSISEARGGLKHELERRESIMRSIDVAVTVMDKRYIVIYANERARRRHGEAIVGNRASWILDPSPWTARAETERALKTGRSQTVQRDIDIDGETRSFRITYFPVIGAGGRVEGFGEAVTDISETIRLQEELELTARDLARSNEDLLQINRALERTDRFKTDFLAGISHELRTPLNSVLGYTQLLLRRREELDEDTLTGVRRIEESARRLLDIVDEILELIQLESGHLLIRPQAVQLADLLERVAVEGKKTIGGRPLELRIDAPQGPEELFTDPDRLAELLVNLVAGAVKVSTAGEVRLAVRSEGERLLFEVSDSGVKPGATAVPESGGDREDDNQHLTGDNLALALVARISELLGGTFTIIRHPGRSRTCRIDLPRNMPGEDGEEGRK